MFAVRPPLSPINPIRPVFFWLSSLTPRLSIVISALTLPNIAVVSAAFIPISTLLSSLNLAPSIYKPPLIFRSFASPPVELTKTPLIAVPPDNLIEINGVKDGY